MKAEVLNAYADRIEFLLANTNIPVRVVGGTKSSWWIQFDLVPFTFISPDKLINQSDKISKALNWLKCPF